MPRSILLILCVLVALPVSASAEEVKATDAASAGEIGRGLLSSKPEVRARAQADLLARIQKGGDLTTFVKAMGDAVAEWADRNERLMELWLHQAVHGTAEEREQAVRLLAALGAPAIRRLSLELRHRIQHEGADGLEPASQQAKAPQEAEDPHASAGSKNPVLPRIYNLADLLERGMNALELRGFIQKAADAVEVKKHAASFIVSATQQGHDALFTRLNELRKSAEQLDELRDDSKKPSPAKPSGGREAPPAEPAGPKPAPPKPNPAPAPAAPKDDGGAGLAGVWRVEPVLFHLSADAWSRAYTSAGKSSRRPWKLPELRTDGAVGVRVGSVRDAATWAQAARRIPDARSDEMGALEGVSTGTSATFFSGRRIRYTGDVERTKGGAWGLVTKTIPHGIGLDLHLAGTGRDLRVELTATRTEVGLPIPVVRVRPSENAAPVELERPEWSTTRARTAFTLSSEGGGAFVALDGLASEQERVVLVLTVEPAMPDPDAAASNVSGR